MLASTRRGRDSGSPNGRDPEVAESWIRRDQSQPIQPSLRRQHPVERVSVRDVPSPSVGRLSNHERAHLQGCQNSHSTAAPGGGVYEQ
jgi:hypothetical protein